MPYACAHVLCKFSIFKDSPEVPKNQTKSLIISNISTLNLTANIQSDSLFSLTDTDANQSVSQITLQIKSGENKELLVNFDPSFKRDFHNEVINGILTITYNEHNYVVSKEIITWKLCQTYEKHIRNLFLSNGKMAIHSFIPLGFIWQGLPKISSFYVSK